MSCDFGRGDVDGRQNTHSRAAEDSELLSCAMSASVTAL